MEPADHLEAEEEIIAGRLDVAVTETLHLAQDAARGGPAERVRIGGARGERLRQREARRRDAGADGGGANDPRPGRTRR